MGEKVKAKGNQPLMRIYEFPDDLLSKETDENYPLKKPIKLLDVVQGQIATKRHLLKKIHETPVRKPYGK